MWISQENENSQGQASDQPKKKTRKETSYHRVGQSFPKSIRILSRKHFQKVSTEGIRLCGKVLFLQFFRIGNRTRLGITVSKKYGKAHDRNRFKRLVREVFREIYDTLPTGVQMNILPRLPQTPLTKNQVEEDFSFFQKQIPSSPPHATHLTQ